MDVLVFAEQRNGSLGQLAAEVVTAGRRLADTAEGAVTALALGPPSIVQEAETLGRYGADRALVGVDDAFGEYAPEAYARLVSRTIEARGPAVVLFPASAQGKDLAPRVAARARAGLASDVTEIEREDGRLVALRPIYAGKLFARVAFETEPAVLSVRPRSFTPQENPREIEIEHLEVADVVAAGQRTRVRRVAESVKERPDVAEAEIVVSGGRGMQGPDNWPILEELVEALGPQAALGASRAVVDAGWRPHQEQVGQTGKVVAPKLYFAIGISGAIQHQAGMRTAGCIVAVNKDREAPIFKIADYGIVGDLFEVVPRLTEAIERLRSAD